MISGIVIGALYLAVALKAEVPYNDVRRLYDDRHFTEIDCQMVCGCSIPSINVTGESLTENSTTNNPAIPQTTPPNVGPVITTLSSQPSPDTPKDPATTSNGSSCGDQKSAIDSSASGKVVLDSEGLEGSGDFDLGSKATNREHKRKKLNKRKSEKKREAAKRDGFLGENEMHHHHAHKERLNKKFHKRNLKEKKKVEATGSWKANMPMAPSWK